MFDRATIGTGVLVRLARLSISAVKQSSSGGHPRSIGFAFGGNSRQNAQSGLGMRPGKLL